ncbi:hypothetical protein [Kineococcus sp. SYSU DK006]|uniref:hypothetical protein n=1 Tax=Kineococcus sp. SYSU DK006 TaxID=3383127 RepID=UPI003D7EC6E1
MSEAPQGTGPHVQQDGDEIPEAEARLEESRRLSAQVREEFRGSPQDDSGHSGSAEGADAPQAGADAER